MSRDCSERGRTAEQVVAQYQLTVRPMHEQYVEPSKQIADLIVHSSVATEPGSPHCLDVACEVLKNHLRVTAGLLDQKPAASIEEALAKIQLEPDADDKADAKDKPPSAET